MSVGQKFDALELDLASHKLQNRKGAQSPQDNLWQNAEWD